MSKTKKIVCRMIPVLILVMFIAVNFMPISQIMANNSGALGTTGINNQLPNATGSIDSVDNLANNVWGTVVTVAQILAFAAIIFAGLRYMFTSADQKAEIKKQTVILVVGAVLVFGASTVVSILMNILEDVTDAV